MKRLAAALLLFASFLGFVHVAHAADAPPNIVLIFTDDQGYGDVGVFGGEKVDTPHLDQMAKEGVRLTDFYVNCPVCSGSRTALMTGCHYQRLSMRAVLFPNSDVGLHPEEVTMADMLKERGYATACIGKWHLGHKPPFLPTKQGFDYYYGIPYSNDMWIDPQAKLADDIKLREGATVESIRDSKRQRNDVPLMRIDEVIEYPADQATLTKRYTEEAIQFIKQNKKKPFFVYLPHTMCHYPLHATEKFKTKKRNTFQAVIAELDWSVGEILKALEQQGLDKNTLVIFTTDNGPAPGSSGPLRAKKGSVFEGGIRVPCIARWPGKIPAGSVQSKVAATMDILPTIAHLTGAKLPQRKIDGHNIWPLLSGQSGAKSPHEAYVLLHARGAVRSGKWKYYPQSPGRRGRRKKGDNPNKPVPMLFDLSADLGENTNVADKHPDVVKKLQLAFEAVRNDVQKNRRPVGRMEKK